MKQKSINQNVQKETNISVVLRALRADSECTRTRLAKETGLTQPSITKIVTQLIEWGTVSELESVGDGVGRKATRLRLNMEQYYVAAVRINRTYINVAIYDMAGKVYEEVSRKISPKEGARFTMKRLVEILDDLFAHTKIPVLSIGVAVPGPYNYYSGRISLMSGFPGWNEIDIRKELEEAFDLPVFVDQDANCGALAEKWYSKSEESSHMLFICADRGIGAGLILDSSVYRGRDGFAGEFGHSSINIFGPRCECGNRGCLELYGSTVALENIYRQEAFDPMELNSLPTDISAEEILALVQDGDIVARRAYSKAVAYLCFGVVGMINTFNPATVVFADKMIEGGNLFLQVADQTFREHLMPEIYSRINVKVCTLKGDPMLLGASVLAYESMLQEPSVYFQSKK